MLNVAPDILDLGLNACALVVRNADNSRTSPELLAYRKKIGQKLAVFWKNRSISSHPAIAEYHRVHQLFGAEGLPPAPEKLITYIRRKRDLTAAGALVDCYNLVSARTLLSIGAHDLTRMSTPITLRRCTEADVYVPLGQTEEQRLTGEYAYIDPDGRVICRLEVLQGDHSKVTGESRDVIFFLQGNRHLPSTVLLKGAWLLAEMIETFCGGSTELVAFHDAPASGEPVGKPAMTIDDFKGLSLQVGTVAQVAEDQTLPGLRSVTVKLGKEVEALTLASDLKPGMQAVVATRLYPLKVGEKKYTGYVLSAQTGERAAGLQLTATIPDGKKLR